MGCIFFSCRGNSASATVQRLDQTYRCVATLTRTYQNQLMYQGFFSHSSNDQGCILELRPWPRLATSSRLVCFPLGPCHKQHKICLALPVLALLFFIDVSASVGVHRENCGFVCQIERSWSRQTGSQRWLCPLKPLAWLTS